MAVTRFAQQLQQLRELLSSSNAPRIRGMEMIANGQAQLDLICKALDQSGCLYTIMDGDSDGEKPRWMITVTGSTDQIRDCVETLLGY